MLTDNEIINILDKSIENDNIDIKQGFTWKTKSKCTLEIIKDIMAMANTQDGGKLIIGFNEKTKEFAGCEENWFKSFDQTDVMNSVNKYVSSTINLQVIKKAGFSCDRKNGNLIIIEIKEFKINPIIAQDGTDTEQNQIFKAGDIFIRTKASTEKIKEERHINDLIRRATLKHKMNIINDIQSLLEDKPIKSVSSDTKKQYLDETSDFESKFHKVEFMPTIKKGIWNVETMPVNKNSELIPFNDLLKIAKSSQSRHRGLPFPIISDEKTKPKNFYLETFVQLDYRFRHSECWRLYRDGLFCWICNMFENEDDKYNETLSKVNSIWTITEMLLFVSRVYEKVSKSDHIYIRLTLTVSNGRKYHYEYPSEYRDPIDIGSKCNSDTIIIERTVSTFNLKMRLKDEVHNVIKELDTHFGVITYDPEYTTHYMEEILDMHMIDPNRW